MRLREESGSPASELIDHVDGLGILGAGSSAGSRCDVERLLHCADVFALCSDTEGFSSAIVEARARDLALVATSGGNLDMMSGRKTDSWFLPAIRLR